jgi:hypothetical protein
MIRQHAIVSAGALSGALVAAVVSAVVVAVADIYLTGHGGQSLTRPWIEWGGSAVALSRGDVAVLVAALVGALTAGIGLREATKRS